MVSKKSILEWATCRTRKWMGYSMIGLSTKHFLFKKKKRKKDFFLLRPATVIANICIVFYLCVCALSSWLWTGTRNCWISWVSRMSRVWQWRVQELALHLAARQIAQPPPAPVAVESSTQHMHWSRCWSSICTHTPFPLMHWMHNPMFT